MHAAAPHRPQLPSATSARNASRDFDYDHDIDHTTRRDASPPSTPSNNPRRRVKKGKQPVRNQRAQQTERIKESDRIAVLADQRHSHGLSWSSVTRDSVVDNLLLSLDSMQMGGGPQDDTFEIVTERDRQRQAPLHAMNRVGQRERGHTYSSSLSSSGYDRHGMTDSPASKYSSPPYRGRRSNSSSNSGAYGIIGKVANGSRTSEDTERAGQSSTRTDEKPGQRSFSYGGRKVSDASSTDFGHKTLQEPSRLGWSGKAASMDQLNVDRSTSDPVLGRGRPVPASYSRLDTNYDAAPEPMVPAGPRKMQNPSATGPVYVNQAQKPSALRKMTTQSDLRSSSNTPVPQDIRDQANDFVRASSMRGTPAVPPTSEKAGSKTLPATSRKDTTSPTRERPGFFKRVFGSTSRSFDRATTSQHTQEPVASRKPSASSSLAITQSRSDTRQASTDATTTTSHPPLSLNKKPSSFFRRRKKSNGDIMPPPPLPLSVQNVAQSSAQSSPSISSLRKVMDPYLGNDAHTADIKKVAREDGGRPTTPGMNESSDDLDMFHSGYTPPPDASMGRRHPLSRETNTSPSKGENDSPRVNPKLKKKRPEVDASTFTPLTDEVTLTRTLSREKAPSSLATNDLDSYVEQPKISPLYETPPTSFQTDDRPVSRASTGDRIIALNGEQEDDMEPASQQTSAEQRDQPVEVGFVASHDQQRPQEPVGTGRLYLTPTTDSEQEMSPKSTVAPYTVLDQSANLPVTPVSAGKTQSPALISPALASPTSPSTRYHSAVSLPLVQVEGNDAPRQSIDERNNEEDTVSGVDDEYRERARRIYEGDEEDISQMEAASWLGEMKTLNSRTLQAYMHLFDFSGHNILSALRMLCGKLILKGETQQFDRIITALSARWCQCNPNHGFKAEDVVHTVCYSVILLNTDLHMADIGEKMSRSAYVKNTLPTIKRVVIDAAPDAFDETMRSSSNAGSRPPMPRNETTNSSTSVPAAPADTPNERTSIELAARPQISKRMSMRPAMFRSDSDSIPTDPAVNSLVNHPWNGNLRGWEAEVETILKYFFASIRAEPLPLLSINAADFPPTERNLSSGNFGPKRSGSLVSRAPSEAPSSRSKGTGLRNLTMNLHSRATRSRPKMYASSNLGSSKTSFDDNNSIWSPPGSSNWSRTSVAKTLTSTSVGSLGHHLTPADRDYKPSIGFANALSQAIIREEGGAGETDSVTLRGELLEDESLALEGAPWAKEGLIKHKHHLEGPDRKAKERNWSECFAVISRGKLTLFAFNTDSSKTRSLSRPRLSSNKSSSSRAGSLAAPRVGGGDWMENAEQLDVFVLRHTISSVLPKPGYSKARPHVWALSLPGGAVHLFQVGTPEIAREWTSTANYWSARLSKEPLQGGVSNIEYGWSDAVINTALLERERSHTSSPPAAMNNFTQHRSMHSTSSNTMPHRQSMQSSLRGSLDIASGGTNSRAPKLPGDKVAITDWHPPSQSMMPSQMTEVDQLRGLTAYVGNVETELEKHNELKQAIDLAYSTRHSNHAKAMTNWQRKSEHLLREIVKFRTYIDSLVAAQEAKEAVYADRAEREAIRNKHVAAAAAAAAADVDAANAAKGRSASVSSSFSGSASVSGSGDDSVSVVDSVEEEERVHQAMDVTPRASRVPPVAA